METAFGQALISTINGVPQRFRMTMQGGPSITMDCRDFIKTREDEDRLLDSIELPDNGAVLDFGCGAGRHLSKVRQRNATIHCYGIDICDLLLDYCCHTVSGPSTFFKTIEDLPHCSFDLIMLMGNGLGVLGSEQETTATLKTLVNSLARKGRILIETGNPFGTGYCSPYFTIEYGVRHDGPFHWGYSDRAWIFRTLQGLGCEVQIQSSKAPGGMFFFAIGQTGEQGAPPDAAKPRR